MLGDRPISFAAQKLSQKESQTLTAARIHFIGSPLF
jgi:hypothetical protein